MFNKRSLLLLLSLVTMLVLAACGGSSNETNSSTPTPLASATTAPTIVPTPTVKKDPIELVLINAAGTFDAKGEDYFKKEFADPVKAKFPHITLTLKKGAITSDLVSTKPQLDLIVATPPYFYTHTSAYDLQTDLDELIKKHNFDVSKIQPTLLDMMKNMGGGKLQSLPLMNSADPVIYYNKDIFDKFGVPYPTDNLTWDDLYELAKRVTRVENGVNYKGLTISPNHYMLRNPYSINLVDPTTLKVDVENDTVKKLLGNITRFFQLPGYGATADNMKVSQSLSMFNKTKEAAMYLSPATIAPLTEEQLQGINWDVAKYPSFADKKGIVASPYPDSIILSSTSKYKDDAFQVLSYLLSDEFQSDKNKRGVFLSVLKDPKIAEQFAQDFPFLKGKNVKAYIPTNPAPAPPMSQYYPTVATNAGQAAVNAIVLEGKDVNTATREARERAVKAVEDLAKK